MTLTIRPTDIELVTVVNGTPAVTTLAIADGAGQPHKNVIAQVRKNIADLEEFGRVSFENASFETPGGKQQREFAVLNEQQASLVLTYMRNSDVVKEFKKRLVREFYRMRDQLTAKPSSPAQMLVYMAHQFLAVEQEQQRQSTEIARIQESVAVIEARTQPENRHFTVLGYANLIGKPVDFGTASKLGRKCADMSRAQGMVIGDVSDPRFGKVHSYHESVLKSVLSD